MMTIYWIWLLQDSNDLQITHGGCIHLLLELKIEINIDFFIDPNYGILHV